MGAVSGILRIVLIAVVILVVLLFVSVALLMGYMGQSASESFESVYIYELTLSTTGPIEHAVLLIPVPSNFHPDTGRNETLINISRIGFSNFDTDTIAASIEYINEIPMLKISADRIDPLYKNRIEPIAIVPRENESELPQPTHIYSDRYSEDTPVLVAMELHLYDRHPGHEIDTRMPIGKEPLFMPYRIVGNLSSSGGSVVEEYYVSPGSSGYFIEVPFILSYDADDENVLSISSEFQGINQWWVLGWRSNSYLERIHHEFFGECNGTYPVKGILVTGEGVY
jgi:hypothetical protein